MSATKRADVECEDNSYLVVFLRCLVGHHVNVGVEYIKFIIALMDCSRQMLLALLKARCYKLIERFLNYELDSFS